MTQLAIERQKAISFKMGKFNDDDYTFILNTLILNKNTRTRADQHKCLLLLAGINPTPLLF